jgi:hypothetical protein
VAVAAKRPAALAAQKDVNIRRVEKELNRKSSLVKTVLRA